MSAPAIAYRIACVPPAAFGGTIPKLIALLIACRWAQEDGRFIVRQAAIIEATGLSRASVQRAILALRSVKVFTDLPAEESLLVVGHLPVRYPTEADRHPTEPTTDRVQASHRGQSASRRPTGPPGDGPPQGIPPMPIGLSQMPSGVSGQDAVSRETSSLSSSPLSGDDSNREGEGFDARAGEALNDATPAEGTTLDDSGESFTDLEDRQLGWLERQGMHLEHPTDGTCMRRDWLRATAGLGTDLVKAILKTTASGFPSHFRKASEMAFGTQVEAARRARAAKIAADLSNETTETAEEAIARVQAEIAAKHAAKAQEVAAEDERERGTLREQGQALLDLVDAVEPRRITLADDVSPGWCAAIERMRTTIAGQGRVKSMDLTFARMGWPRVRDRELPPVSERPMVERSFIEPADAP